MSQDVSAGTLVERDHEQGRLDHALTTAAGGSGASVIVRGPAGIGKTRLLQHVRAEAADRGVRVLRARGSELEHDFAWGVMRGLLEPLLREGGPELITELLSGSAAPATAILGDGATTAERSPTLLYALYWVIARVCDEGPVAIVVDDAQWADPLSLEALAFLGQRLEDLPLALIIATRAEGRPAPLHALRDAAVLEPAALSPAGTRALADAHGARDLGEAAAFALHRATNGNPLFVAQMADGIARDGGDVGSVLGERAARFSTATLNRVLLDRLGRLSEQAGAVAHAVATLGDGAELRHVAAFAALSPEQVLLAAGELASAALFEDEPDRLAFVHPVVAAAVADDRGRHARALDHLLAARTLRATDAPAERIAAHLLRTPPQGDPSIADDLRAAARNAQRCGAAEGAVTLLQRAVAEPPRPEEAADVVCELGLAELAAGQYAAASEHLDGPLPAPLGVVWGRAYSQFLTVGLPSATKTFAAGAAAAVDPDDALSLAGLGTLAFTILPRSTWPDLPLPDLAGLEGRTRGERLALCGHAARLANGEGDAAAAAGAARRAAANGLVGPQVLPDADAMAPVCEGVDLPTINVLLVTEHLDEADAVLELYLNEPTTPMWSHGRAIALAYRADMRLAAGDAAAADADSASAARLVTRLPGADAAWTARIVAEQLAAVRLVHAGPEAAEVALADAGLMGQLAPEHSPVLAIRGAIHLAAARTDLALADLQAFSGVAVAMGERAGQRPWRGFLAAAQIAAGDIDAARATAADHLAAERAWGAPGRIAGALRTTAEAHAGQSIALDALEEAVATAEGSQMRLEEAACRVAYGFALRRAGRRSDARGELERGADLAHHARAEPLAQRAREELAILGARPRRRAFSGVDALTASERRVCELASTGATNREIAVELFVGPKTVETHLGRAYRKLGIESRTELSGALAAKDQG